MTNEKLKSNLEKIGFVNPPSEGTEFYVKGNFRVLIDTAPYIVVYKGIQQSFNFWYEFLNFYNRHKHKDK